MIALLRGAIRSAALAATTVVLVATSALSGCGTHNRTVDIGSADAPVASMKQAAAADAVTPPTLPPFYPGDEATPVQLERALGQGKAVRREIEWVEREEAAAHGEMAAGEYLVTYLVTPADDYYDLEAAQSRLPAHHTTVVPGSAHVAIVVRDAADGRIVEGLVVRATLQSEQGGEKRSGRLPYGWHPVLNRYGENMVLPASPIALTVEIDMPDYARHDRTNGNRFTRSVIARFVHVNVSADSLAAAAQRLARGDSRDAVNLARLEGNAVNASLADLLRSAGVSGAEVRAGDYRVAVVARRADGNWSVRNGDLHYAAPETGDGPTAHLDVMVRDEITRRFVPELVVQATVLNSHRKDVGTYTLPFMWHPWINHYGMNVPIPGRGSYTIRVHAEAPAFRRYGSAAPRKFTKAINARVNGVRFVTTRRAILDGKRR